MSYARRTFLKGVLATAAATTPLTAVPAQASTIDKAHRDLLLFLSNLAPSQQPQKAFYELVAFSAEGLALPLGAAYRKMHVVKGSAATRQALSATLDTIASTSVVTAVDLIFVTHGLSDQVVFSDTAATMKVVRDDIKAKLSVADRAKLRCVFSTACYGASHTDEWREAGFKAATGSRRIYADSATSYPVLLSMWGAGHKFNDAVAAANNVDPLRFSDNAAKQLLKQWNYPSWEDVDSVRVVSGNGTLTINAMA
jgi:hypothetical protein